MPTVISIEEIIADIKTDPLRDTIATYIKHLTAVEIDNYFLAKINQTDKNPFIFYLFTECSPAIRNAMLIKLQSLQRLDAALDMTDCSGNKLFTYITTKVNEFSGRYETYSLELRSGRPSAATEYLAVVPVLTEVASPAKLAEILTERQVGAGQVGLEILSVYGKYGNVDHFLPMIAKADKDILGAALVKNPGLLKSLRGIGLRNALAANLSSHADKAVEEKKETHASEDNWQQVKPLLVHMRYEDLPFESKESKPAPFSMRFWEVERAAPDMSQLSPRSWHRRMS